MSKSGADKKKKLQAYHRKIYQSGSKDPAVVAMRRARNKVYRERTRAKRLGIVYVETPKEKSFNEVTKPARPKAYLNNRDLLAQVIASKKTGIMNMELAKMLMLLVRRYATKANWAGYSYNEDMQSLALLDLCRGWSKFNEKKYSNAFAYFTQSIKNSFLQQLKHEKKQQVVKDVVRMEAGFDPSSGYEDTNETL